MTSAGTSRKEKKIESISIFERNEVPCDEFLENQSPSYVSYNSKTFGHTFDYVDDVATSNASIGSISVQNSTDVSLGNKTYFNGPVMMKQMAVDNGRPKSDKSESVKQTKTNDTSNHKIQRFLQQHRFLVFSIFTAVAVIITTAVLLVYFLNVPSASNNGNLTPATCEEIPSTPTHYTCGYASGCTRCRALFPDNEICQSYYEPNCGDLRCFCKPQCRSVDCR